MVKKKLNTNKTKFISLSIIGSIISVIAAKICCIGPIALAVLGASSADLFSNFDIFRPYFIAVTTFLLGLAFYLTYRRKKELCKDGTCNIKNAGKWNKIILWIGTGLIAFIMVYPHLNLSSKNSSDALTEVKIVEVTIPVVGMTCLGCEFTIENAVQRLKGIYQVKANHKKGEVYIKYEKGKITIDRIIQALNETGYKAFKPNESSKRKEVIRDDKNEKS